MEEDPKIGLIGCGNMGSAVARALCQAVSPKNIFLANRTPEKAQKLAAALGCCVAESNLAAAQTCDVIFLAIKPQGMAAMLSEIAPALAARPQRPMLVSMAAGLTMEQVRTMAGGICPVIRMMPNTPAAVGAGMIQFCCRGASASQKQLFQKLLTPAGRLDEIDEGLMDAASCVSGCGPAWAYQFIEALADGGVACGLPRAKAMEYAAQMLAGSAQMVLQSGLHPGALKDAVCSPGGSTIQGVRILEQRAFRGAVTDAVIAAYDKTKDIAK